MTTLQALDSPKTPLIGGYRSTFPSGKVLDTHWQSAVPILPTKDAAQQYAAATLQRLLDSGLSDDAERTNWPSFTAAVQRIISDFNDRTVARVHQAAGNAF